MQRVGAIPIRFIFMALKETPDLRPANLTHTEYQKLLKRIAHLEEQLALGDEADDTSIYARLSGLSFIKYETNSQVALQAMDGLIVALRFGAEFKDILAELNKIGVSYK